MNIQRLESYDALKRKTERYIEQVVSKQGPAPILLHNHQNTQYVGALEVGTPGQSMMSIFDTGYRSEPSASRLLSCVPGRSGTFWVPSKACKAVGCNEHTPFDDGKSRCAWP